MRGARPRPVSWRASPLPHRLLYNKYYVDELYDLLIVKPLYAVSRFLWTIVDTYVIDGVLVKFSAFTVRSAGRGIRLMQTGNAQTYLLVFLVGAAGLCVYFWQGFGI